MTTLKRLFISIAVTGAFALAQDKGPASAPNPAPNPPRSPDVLRVIPIKLADVDALANIIGRVTGGLAQLTPDATRRVLIVRGTAEAVTVVEEAVKALDQPPAAKPATPNLELTVYLLYGANQEGRGDAVPQDLVPTVKQLSALFPYKSYRVLESFVLRGRDGQETQTSGSLPNSQNTYSFQYRPFVLPGPAPRMVRIDNLRLGLRLALSSNEGFNYFDSGLSTGLDAREGQKVVVGKSNMRGTDDAIILVITPKVIE